jgi:parallel beta-helix repeat protein
MACSAARWSTASSSTARRTTTFACAREPGRADTGRVDLGFHYGASAEQVLTYETPLMPLYVRATGSDIDDGMSPASAFASIRTAARRARAGITVVVGPGTYAECDINSPPDSGRATFLADPSGERTGDPAGVTLVDAGRCYFDPIGGGFTPGQTGFNLTSTCGVVVDGFHVRGAADDGIQLQGQSDGAQVRNNVVFANARRGINVINSDDVRIANNLAYGNNGGIQTSSGTLPEGACAEGGARRAVIEYNTVYGSLFNGILVGAGLCPSTGATVRYNITAENGRDNRAAGIEVGSDERREENLVGYVSRYNLVADRYAAGVPRGIGDLLVDYAREPLFVDAGDISTDGDWRLDRRFRLMQRAAGQTSQTRAVDYSDLTALKAGLATRSTRSDGAADDGLVDLGYHYPSGARILSGDCDGDGAVTVNEIITAVNIALGNSAVDTCPAASSDGDTVAIADLIAAVNALLQGQA